MRTVKSMLQQGSDEGYDPTDKIIDREHAFQLYATFCGDVERTAHALGCKPVDVLEMARAGNWQEVLKPIIEMKKSSKPGDVERAVNRALNFVQANRYRIIVERLMRVLYDMDDRELRESLITDVRDKDGNVTQRFSAKYLADLASAMEKAHALSYQALQDTATDRNKRGDVQDPETSAQEMHLQIADAMARIGSDRSPNAQLFDRQLEAAQKLLAEKQQSAPETK